MMPVSLSTTARCCSFWNSSARDACDSPRTMRTSSPRPSETNRLTALASSSVASTNSPMRDRMWSRSHGTAVNCTRWVSSCRHTQSRKSCGSTFSCRSACTMLGATSIRRPPALLSLVVPSQNGSNCPSTLPDMNDISAPISAPLSLEPMARAAPLGALPSDSRRASTGSMRMRNVARFASTQRRRSTTRMGASAETACRSVNSRTGASDFAAASRSSATTSATCSGLISGPGLDSRVAVWSATFQSIMTSTVRR